MLNIQNLKKSFNIGTDYEKPLFDKLNLKINSGEFVTVLGTNGAGKSSLFKCINGENDVENGSIHIDKNDISIQKFFERSKIISTVNQDPKLGTIGEMTVLENLSMAELKGSNATLKKCLDKSRINNYISLLEEYNIELEKKLNVKTSLLSGGQRQVLSIIMATLKNPQILLLDEHTAALDPKTSKRVMEITESIINKHNITCLMITHKLEDAIRYGNRLILIDSGKIALDISGEKKLNLTKDELLKFYLS